MLLLLLLLPTSGASISRSSCEVKALICAARGAATVGLKMKNCLARSIAIHANFVILCQNDLVLAGNACVAQSQTETLVPVFSLILVIDQRSLLRGLQKIVAAEVQLGVPVACARVEGEGGKAQESTEAEQPCTNII